jgi:uncharacterized protein (DUF1800 family)
MLRTRASVRSADELTPAMKARIAYMRFGLGPKQNGAAAIGREPDSALEALHAEIDRPGVALIPQSQVVTYSSIDRADIELTIEKCTWFGAEQVMRSGQWVRPLGTDILAAERAARFVKQLEPNIGFVERLVMFWSNHFNVFKGKHSFVSATAGHMERTVIRQHVLGNFRDMLKGVVQHPAMIFYLDNHAGVGPKSERSLQSQRSGGQAGKINENLAREILELHTLGVKGGYGQADVVSLANIITGWTLFPTHTGTAAERSKRGQFTFNASVHEPGPFTVMRRSFPENGQQQGLAALDMLASHPNTALHISRKLLRHFITDNPSPRMVKSLAATFTRTRGDLKAVAKALINMEDAWSTPMNRLRLPYPWLVSMMRAMALTRAQVVGQEPTAKDILEFLSNHVWGHQTPEGYTDLDTYWKNPDAIRLRRNMAKRYVEAVTRAPIRVSVPSVGAVAENLMGDALSSESLSAVKSITSGPDALNLLFVTPEYLRR